MTTTLQRLPEQPMPLKLRDGPDGIIEVSNDDFRRLAREGVVRGDTPVWGKIFTNGEWWTAADLRMFHENSPTATPKGPRLLEEEQGEQRRKEQRERLVRFREQHAKRKLDALGLTDLGQLLGRDGILGAARFWVCPSFDPQVVMTVIFLVDQLQVTITKPASNYWLALPRLGSPRHPDGTLTECVLEPFDPGKVTHTQASLFSSQAHVAFASWEEYTRRTELAVSVSCLMSDCLDGMHFTIEFLRHNGVYGTSWDYPKCEEHDELWEFIQAHQELERTAMKLGRHT